MYKIQYCSSNISIEIQYCSSKYNMSNSQPNDIKRFSEIQLTLAMFNRSLNNFVKFVMSFSIALLSKSFAVLAL